MKKNSFIGRKTAKLNADKCIQCGICYYNCRFSAISPELEFDSAECEGCGVCAYLCPFEAIEMTDHISGEYYISQTRYGPLVYAQLEIGEENSGKLATTVRQLARQIANAQAKKTVIVDGPPGVGCQTIASITGSDYVLIVTEASVAGWHDLQRISKLVDHFGYPAGVCINRASLNPEMAAKINRYCQESGLEVLEEIPFSEEINHALWNRKTICEALQGEIPGKIESLWRKICARLQI